MNLYVRYVLSSMFPRTWLALGQVGGPVGRPLDVGICMGVPPSHSELPKVTQTCGIVELSLHTPGFCAPAGQPADSVS
jgi:hypothetical protein